jgi:hypothetical protein
VRVKGALAGCPMVHVTPGVEYDASGVAVDQTGTRACIHTRRLLSTVRLLWTAHAAASSGGGAWIALMSVGARPQHVTVVDATVQPAVTARLAHSAAVKTTNFDSGPCASGHQLCLIFMSLS